MSKEFTDLDPQETQEWLESFDGVVEREGIEKGQYLLEKLVNHARSRRVSTAGCYKTPYLNTIPPEGSEKIPPENSDIARSIAAYVRWNAMAMVVKANRQNKGIGGHIASFSSSAALYEVGFDYFFRGKEAPNGGDLIFYQGHAAPGMYARAFVEGVLDLRDLENFRQEAFSKGLSSYPHPWLMPEFWEFPTVSMGLGPLMAIYFARFMKYMENRGHSQVGDRKVWAFLGDGEMDEPESRGAISLGAREHLDNLIFVINCNLQRLDGPVRGNGSVIQELEAYFRGAGWRVIKVLWGTEWDPLFAKDKKNLILRRMEGMTDGEFQNLRAKDGAYIREHFFGTNAELLALVKDMSDEQLWRLSRGGLDPRKIYPAYAEAIKTKGSPVVILAHTVKGYGMGRAGEATNATHNVKDMDLDSLRVFRDRFRIPVTDEQLESLPFVRPEAGSRERVFIDTQRKKLGGPILRRNREAPPLPLPKEEAFKALLESGGTRKFSTTIAFVRLLGGLLRDKGIAKNIVPIVPDEARTFGMEGMFRQLGIYSPHGQLYRPQDADLVAWYREDRKGQILEEGISEAGAFSSWLAAGTAYSHHGVNMAPFFIFYSMFGFQRIGDLAWAGGDMRVRGFLLGAIAGKTTLMGEGLQHQDGHSLLLASTYPTCQAYDPTFAYELAVIVEEGFKRMFHQQEDIFYYITLQNEVYEHPRIPEGSQEGIKKGIYLVKEGTQGNASSVQLMGSGAVLRESLAAQEILQESYGVSANVWSVLGLNQLHREGSEIERWNLLHPEEPKESYLTKTLKGQTGFFVITTDYVRAYAEQIRRLIPGKCYILGTDGFGRSDTREALRAFFEIDRHHIVLTALKGLLDEGSLSADAFAQAIKKQGLDPQKVNPLWV